MFTITNNELGKITISAEVAETIAGIAAMDSYGLVGMVAQDWQSNISALLGMENVRKGVKVTQEEDGLVVDVYVIIAYGMPIAEVAMRVMQNVKYALENNAKIPVHRVNVCVKGVRVQEGN